MEFIAERIMNMLIHGWLGWSNVINIACIVLLQIEIFVILGIMQYWGDSDE